MNISTDAIFALVNINADKAEKIVQKTPKISTASKKLTPIYILYIIYPYVIYPHIFESPVIVDFMEYATRTR